MIIFNVFWGFLLIFLWGSLRLSLKCYIFKVVRVFPLNFCILKLVRGANTMEFVEAFRKELHITYDILHDGSVVTFWSLDRSDKIPSWCLILLGTRQSVSIWWINFTFNPHAVLIWDIRLGGYVWVTFSIKLVGGSPFLWTSHIIWWPICSTFQTLHSIPNACVGVSCF